MTAWSFLGGVAVSLWVVHGSKLACLVVSKHRRDAAAAMALGAYQALEPQPDRALLLMQDAWEKMPT